MLLLLLLLLLIIIIIMHLMSNQLMTSHIFKEIKSSPVFQLWDFNYTIITVLLFYIFFFLLFSVASNRAEVIWFSHEHSPSIVWPAGHSGQVFVQTARERITVCAHMCVGACVYVCVWVKERARWSRLPQEHACTPPQKDLKQWSLAYKLCSALPKWKLCALL